MHRSVERDTRSVSCVTNDDDDDGNYRKRNSVDVSV